MGLPEVLAISTAVAFCSVVNFLRFLGGMGTSSFCFIFMEVSTFSGEAQWDLCAKADVATNLGNAGHQRTHTRLM